MTPRPIHRWKTLWLGLLILAFLGWASVRSIGHVTSFSYTFNSKRWEVRNLDGALGLHFDPQSFENPGFQAISIFIGRPRGQGIWFPDAIAFRPSKFNSEGHVKVAHWFLILLFLIPWAALLIRRHRRLKQHHKKEMDGDG